MTKKINISSSKVLDLALNLQLSAQKECKYCAYTISEPAEAGQRNLLN